MLSYCNVAGLIHTLGRIHSYRVSRRVFPLFYHQQKTGQEIPEELDSEESLDRFPFIIFLFIFRHRFKNGFWNEEAERERKPFVVMLDPRVTFALNCIMPTYMCTVPADRSYPTHSSINHNNLSSCTAAVIAF